MAWVLERDATDATHDATKSRPPTPTPRNCSRRIMPEEIDAQVMFCGDLITELIEKHDIKHSLNLKSIEKKSGKLKYSNPQQFTDDVHELFASTLRDHRENEDKTKQIIWLQHVFEQKFSRLPFGPRENRERIYMTHNDRRKLVYDVCKLKSQKLGKLA